MSTESARIWRREHPIRYAYNNIKNRAKQRGIPFELTIEEFTTFCNSTNYIEMKGRHKDGYTIDRIEESGGYSIDNIQIIPLVTNIKKYYKRAS